MKSTPTVTIIGAGLGGCFMAILLAKRGYKVNVYEKFSQDDIINFLEKRSFNLTFYEYAVKSFKGAGLWRSIKPHVIPLKGSVTQIGRDSQSVHGQLNSY